MLGNIVIAPTMGKNLYNTETFGKADPYVVVSMGAQSSKTEVHHNGGTNPRWESKFTFPVTSMMDVIKFIVYDKEHMGKDDLMGEGSFAISQLSRNPKWVGDVQLMRKNKPAGSIQCEFEFQRA